MGLRSAAVRRAIQEAAAALRAAGAHVAFVARDAQRVAAVDRRLPGTHGLVGDVDQTYRLTLRIDPIAAFP